MIRILHGDCRSVLPTLADGSVHACVTSPPYHNLRSYLGDDHPDKAQEIGSEASVQEYVAALVETFRGVWRVLRGDGVCFVNLGDAYGRGTRGRYAGDADRSICAKDAYVAQGYGRGGSANAGKQLLELPSRLAMALQDDGWYLRSRMPWVRRSCMPESVQDRPTSAIEYVFMLTKGAQYFWDAEAVRQRGAIPAGARAAKASASRASASGVNSRPPEYATYSGTRNFRNSDLFFASLEPPYGLILDEAGMPLALDVNPEPLKEAHYAAFPAGLVTPLIQGATSERGCCPGCGAPWHRETQRTNMVIRKTARNEERGTRTGTSGTMLAPATCETIGWHPTCDCCFWRCKSCDFVLDTKHEKTTAGTTQYVCDMRRGLSPVQAQRPVLQPGLLSEPPQEADSDSVQAMREGICADRSKTTPLLKAVCSAVVGEESPVNEGMDDLVQGLSVDIDAKPSERHEGWLRDGTSACDGAQVGAPSRARRSGQPQEWGQAGQSHHQPRIDAKARTRRRQAPDLRCDVPPLPTDVPNAGTCPHCGSGLERATPSPVPCVVLDCFAGAGTALLAAHRLQRNAIGIELNGEYVAMMRRRLERDAGMFAEVAAE